MLYVYIICHIIVIQFSIYLYIFLSCRCLYLFIVLLSDCCWCSNMLHLKNPRFKKSTQISQTFRFDSNNFGTWWHLFKPNPTTWTFSETKKRLHINAQQKYVLQYGTNLLHNSMPRYPNSFQANVSWPSSKRFAPQVRTSGTPKNWAPQLTTQLWPGPGCYQLPFFEGRFGSKMNGKLTHLFWKIIVNLIHFWQMNDLDYVDLVNDPIWSSTKWTFFACKKSYIACGHIAAVVIILRSHWEIVKAWSGTAMPVIVDGALKNPKHKESGQFRMNNSYSTLYSTCIYYA